MLKLNEYGKKLVENFYEQCKTTGTYDKVFVDFEDGTCLLESSVRGVKDCAALYIITYDKDAIDTVKDWKEEDSSRFCWSTNWDDMDNAFTITYDEVLNELRKCFTETIDDTSIQLTLTSEEIAELASASGCDIVDKETLHDAVLMAIEKYIETYKEAE